MASFKPLSVTSLDAGMISAYPVTIMPQDQGFTRMLMNFDFDEIPGVVRKRYGTERLFPRLNYPAKGAFQFLEAGIEPNYIVSMHDKILTIQADDLTWTQISPVEWALSTSPTCDFTSILGVLIVSDGVNQPFKWDGTAATVLTNMPKARFITELRGRIFAAGIGTDPLALRGSHVGDPTIWDETDVTKNAFLVYPGGEGAITSITTIEDIILIGKKYSLHMLVGTTIHDFQVIPVDTTIGIGSHWSVKHIRGSAYFVSSEGEIYSIEAGTRPERLSGPIQDIIRTVNISRIEEARAAVMEKYHYVVTLPVSVSSFITLIYDIIRRRWRMSDLHIGTSAVSEEVLGYCFTKPGGQQLYRLDPDSVDDDGVAVEAYVETMEYHFGAPKAEKELNNLWVGLWTTADDVKFYVDGSFDGKDWEILTPSGVLITDEANLYKQVRIPIGKNCYNAQFRIRNNRAGEQLRLLDLIISYITKEVE